MKEKDQERALAIIDEDPGLHGLRHLRAPYLDMEVGGMLYELVRWVRILLLSSGAQPAPPAGTASGHGGKLGVHGVAGVPLQLCKCMDHAFYAVSFCRSPTC